ncbi:Protein SAR DEFICIENT 1 [Carex littledalei]|uniref:Protein SAR DEFICIENT 1 n=1 Tax=Carex littledalei TaxID=544730 RepID=A0A833VS42_9POAL|nr:Protein SAR DEFICIENT 1 [Carex littledalei]
MENGRKRPWEELGLDVDQNQPQSSRMRTTPSFISVIRGAMLAETIRNICLSMEPIIRRVVREEVQLLVCGPNPLYGNRQYYIEEAVPTPQFQPSQSRDMPTHKLVFANQVVQTIYTGNNITDNDKMPIEIQLVGINTGKICTTEEGSPIKVKIAVIDGDLDLEGLDSDKFSSKIVKARDGKRPLLVGNTEVTLNQGVGIIGDTYFTDNSKWLRSGKFRLGACIDSERCGTVIKIQEGLSEKFTVKDHRGEYTENVDKCLEQSCEACANVPYGAQQCRFTKSGCFSVFSARSQGTVIGAYGHGAESEAGAVPIIYSSFSSYLVGSAPDVDFWSSDF